MDIQKEKNAFLSIYVCYQGDSRKIQFNEETEQFMWRKNNVSDSEVEYVHLMNQRWYAWLACAKSKANAVHEGFVLVPVKEIKTWYLDESENIYREDPDWLCDTPVGKVVEVEHRISYELDQDPVFAAIQWDDKNDDIGYYEIFKTKEEAEKVAAHCKAMIEAQEHF